MVRRRSTPMTLSAVQWRGQQRLCGWRGGEHIEYVPFGEVFVEERNNIWNTPYLFNAETI